MSETGLSVKLLRHTPDPEGTVALAARLCYSNLSVDDLECTIKKSEQEQYIKKILVAGHLSTIEHASFTFGIEGVSRSLLAQISRHRIASFSVKSQRYVVEQKERDETFNYIIPPKIKELGPEYEKRFTKQMAQIQLWYNQWYQELGGKASSAAEDARFVLPNAAETKMVMTMNARELYHFFQLRCCERAQWEIRGLAWEMLRLVRQIAPNIFAYAGPACLFSGCPEGTMSCGKSAEVKRRFAKL
jgi:thymidylate synthase (FAD)